MSQHLYSQVFVWQLHIIACIGYNQQKSSVPLNGVRDEAEMYCSVIKCFIWSASELLLAKKIRDGDSLTNKQRYKSGKKMSLHKPSFYTHWSRKRKIMRMISFRTTTIRIWISWDGDFSWTQSKDSAGYGVGFIEVRINSILRCLQSSYSKLSSNTWATSKPAENKKQNSTAVIFVEITWKVIGTAKSFDTP